jgi:hypothetical protein
VLSVNKNKLFLCYKFWLCDTLHTVALKLSVKYNISLVSPFVCNYSFWNLLLLFFAITYHIVHLWINF